jgi:hypothetical protein
MPIMSKLYWIVLGAYPPVFRLRYRGEMVRVFEDGLRDARTDGLGATLRYCGNATGDLIAGATRERFLATDRMSAGASLSAIVAGVFASYIDFHANEVQATLLVLMATSFLLGCAAPKGAWRRAAMIAALLPAVHIAVYASGKAASNQGHPYFSRLMMFWPALVASLFGAYAGVFLRFVSRGLAGWFAPRGGSDPGAMA